MLLIFEVCLFVRWLMYGVIQSYDGQSLHAREAYFIFLLLLILPTCSAIFFNYVTINNFFTLLKIRKTTLIGKILIEQNATTE